MGKRWQALELPSLIRAIKINLLQSASDLVYERGQAIVSGFVQGGGRSGLSGGFLTYEDKRPEGQREAPWGWVHPNFRELPHGGVG